MAMPQFRAAGTASNQTGSPLTPGIPTHQPGDALLLLYGGINDYGDPSGGSVSWTLMVSYDTSAAQLRLYYAWAASSSETAPTLSGGAGLGMTRILSYSGGIGVGNVFYDGEAIEDLGQSLAWPVVAPQTPNSLVFSFAMFETDSNTNPSGTLTNASLSNITERINQAPAGGRLFAFDGELASPVGGSGETTGSIVGTTEAALFTGSIVSPQPATRLHFNSTASHW